MKKIMMLAWACLFSIAMLSAQGVEEVTLVVSGDGATKEEATHVALRSAIEQAFGCFVSANTEILNDSLVKDEIITISSGNIQKYTELAYMQMENGKSYVSLQTTVSLTKLVKYAQSKGAECEFAGATFAANVKLYELNKANSEKALQNILTVLENTDNLFDYVLKVGEPRINSKGQVGLGFGIYLYANQNTANFYRYMNTTLKAISYTEEQIQPFQNMGYRFYQHQEDEINLTFGKTSYRPHTPKIAYFYQPIFKGAYYRRKGGTDAEPGYFFYQMKDILAQKAADILLNDNIGNQYAISKEDIGIYYDDSDVAFGSFTIDCDDVINITQGIFPYTNHRTYGPSDTNCYNSLGLYRVSGCDKHSYDFLCYFNMDNAIGYRLAAFGTSLSIPKDTVGKFSNFYLTKKDGTPVPTTTIFSEDGRWAGTPPQTQTKKEVLKIKGIPVCTEKEYMFGDSISAYADVSVIFRLGEVKEGYTYIKVKPLCNEERKPSISYKVIKKYGYYDVRITYLHAKHEHWGSDMGDFRIPISVDLHQSDGNTIWSDTVYITGNIDREASIRQLREEANIVPWSR